MAQKKSASLEQRRQRILDAARDVFESEGGLEAGLRQIASAAGCTTGAIYKMFSGKEDIYAALLEESLCELSNTVAKAAAKQKEPKAALRAAAHALVRYYQNHQFEYRLGLYLFEKDSRKGLGAARDQKLNELLAQSMDVFAAYYLQLGDKAGQKIKNTAKKQTKAQAEAVARAHALFASLIGVLALYFSGRDRSLKTSWQKILDSLLIAHID